MPIPQPKGEENGETTVVCFTYIQLTWNLNCWKFCLVKCEQTSYILQILCYCMHTLAKHS